MLTPAQHVVHAAPASLQDAPLFRAWIVLALLIPVYVGSMFYRMAPTVLSLDLVRDLGVTTSQVALLSGATMMGYGLMQLPSGLLADSLGGRRTIFLFTLLVGGATLWFGATASFYEAATARLLAGLGMAVTVPCLALLARSFPPGMYGRVSSLLLASGTCGTLLASAPLAMVSEFSGWRPVMIVCGIFSLLLAFLVLFLVRETPAKTTPESREKERKRGLWNGLHLVLTTRAFWPLCISFTCLISVYFSFAGMWWGPYLMQACGLSKEETGNILFIAVLAAVPAMPLLAVLSDRLKSRKRVLVPCTAAALLAIAVATFFPGQLGVPALVLQAMVFTAACGLGAVAFASVRELFPLDVVGTATGCLNTLPPVGAALAQKLFGMVLDRQMAAHGDATLAYADAMYVNLALLIVAMVAILFIKETFIRSGSSAS